MTDVANLDQRLPQFASLGELWKNSLEMVIKDGTWEVDADERIKEIRNLSAFVLHCATDDPILRAHADQARIDLMLQKYRSTSIVPPYHISYGGLIYDNNGVDQIAAVTNQLRAKRETKSAIVTLVVPGATEQACLSALDFKVRNDAVTLTAVYRSQNVFASQPGNLLAMQEILDDVCASIDAEPAGIVLHALSAHIYERDFAAAQAISY